MSFCGLVCGALVCPHDRLTLGVVVSSDREPYLTVDATETLPLNLLQDADIIGKKSCLRRPRLDCTLKRLLVRECSTIPRLEVRNHGRPL